MPFIKSAAPLWVAVVAAAAVTTPADAANLAIFGDNNIASYYTSLGDSVTIVSDSQLATAGFLDSYDAFVYTRDGYSFGTSLSAAAAANVKSYVTGNVVLLSGDFQDDIGTADTNRLFSNVRDYITARPHGYLGEFNGALAAFASNDSNYTPIGLVNGAAGTLGRTLGGSDGDVDLTAAGAASPISQGVAFPYNPSAVEYGFSESGYNPAKVIADFENGSDPSQNGNPAIIASGVEVISMPSGVPEPATWAMMIGGFGFAGGMLRGRRRTTVRFA